jgi:hypothetical protein
MKTLLKKLTKYTLRILAVFSVIASIYYQYELRLIVSDPAVDFMLKCQYNQVSMFFIIITIGFVMVSFIIED